MNLYTVEYLNFCHRNIARLAKAKLDAHYIVAGSMEQATEIASENRPAEHRIYRLTLVEIDIKIFPSNETLSSSH